MGWIDHDGFLSPGSLVNVVGEVKATDTNQRIITEERKFRNVRLPCLLHVVQAQEHFLVEGLLNIGKSCLLLDRFQVSFEGFAVAAEFDSDPLVRLKDRDLDLLDDKAHFHDYLRHGWLLGLDLDFNFLVAILAVTVFFVIVFTAILGVMLLLGLFFDVLGGVCGLADHIRDDTLFDVAEPI